MAAAMVAATAACGTPASGQSPSISVVAAENFWGNIAAQLGGERVSVQSVVTDPNADPHEYESSAGDARAFADARLVILNGAGYDDWVQKLLDANPAPGRVVLNVAASLGKRAGDNPHFWYRPDFVVRVVDLVAAQYEKIDPAGTGYFESRRSDLTTTLEPYLATVAEIKQRFAGTPVGSTESIFVYLAAALGLDLTTPPEFMQAVSEGNDPPAGAVVTFQNQISARQIRVLVYNTQTTTAVTTNIKALAAANHIPSVGVSETLQPLNVSFQQWQLGQLQKLEAALASAA